MKKKLVKSRPNCVVYGSTVFACIHETSTHGTNMLSHGTINTLWHDKYAWCLLTEVSGSSKMPPSFLAISDWLFGSQHCFSEKKHPSDKIRLKKKKKKASTFYLPQQGKKPIHSCCSLHFISMLCVRYQRKRTPPGFRPLCLHKGDIHHQTRPAWGIHQQRRPPNDMYTIKQDHQGTYTPSNKTIKGHIHHQRRPSKDIYTIKQDHQRTYTPSNKPIKGHIRHQRRPSGDIYTIKEDHQGTYTPSNKTIKGHIHHQRDHQETYTPSNKTFKGHKRHQTRASRDIYNINQDHQGTFASSNKTIKGHIYIQQQTRPAMDKHTVKLNQQGINTIGKGQQERDTIKQDQQARDTHHQTRPTRD